MPAAISTSLTTGDTRAYVYPENAAYVVEPRPGDILYSMLLMPKPKPKAT
jgi:hypothetical protein